jgi:hypothetical protein
MGISADSMLIRGVTAMDIYRKIWIKNNGPIPMDENGITYEIHHIDGDHSNNHIDNLMCVSIQEHYDIHYDQEDWAACLLISKRMRTEQLSKTQRSLLSKHNAMKRLNDGTHNFLNREFQILRGKRNSVHQKRLLETGEHIASKNVTCPHCGKNGKGAVMLRWHFENCKERSGE